MIDLKLQAELRARFNPDGSELREMQLKLLEVLDVVDMICKKNDIPYWLDSGSLIGAVRHRGFIPWDDDIDIAILYKDKKRFIECCKRDLPKGYVVHYHGTDPSYCSSILKVRNEMWEMQEVTRFGGKEYQVHRKYKGYFVDIFTEELSVEPLVWLTKIPFRILLLAQFKWEVNRYALSALYYLSEFIYMVLRFIAFLIPWKKYLYHSYGSFGMTSRRVKKEIFPLRTISFEGHTFNIPNDTDAYLHRVFGEYMQLPPLSERCHRHNVSLPE